MMRRPLSLLLAVVAVVGLAGCKPWPSMTPAEKCASALELIYYRNAQWTIECTDQPLGGDTRRGECYCWPGHDPHSFRLVATTYYETADVSWADQRRNLALTIAHEMGHAYLAQFDPERFDNPDGTPNETFPERFAVEVTR